MEIRTWSRVSEPDGTWSRACLGPRQSGVYLIRRWSKTQNRWLEARAFFFNDARGWVPFKIDESGKRRFRTKMPDTNFRYKTFVAAKSVEDGYFAKLFNGMYA